MIVSIISSKNFDARRKPHLPTKSLCLILVFGVVLLQWACVKETADPRLEAESRFYIQGEERVVQWVLAHVGSTLVDGESIEVDGFLRQVYVGQKLTIDYEPFMLRLESGESLVGWGVSAGGRDGLENQVAWTRALTDKLFRMNGVRIIEYRRHLFPDSKGFLQAKVIRGTPIIHKFGNKSADVKFYFN